MAHTIARKIYYEDTDAGEVVYYANYLRYTEAARTEYLNDHGIDIYKYHREGFYFVVSRAEVDYKKPARLGDTITVSTVIVEMRKASMLLRHEIRRGGELLVEAFITLAYISRDGRPRRLPPEVAALGQPDQEG